MNNILFYKDIAPLNRESHRDVRVKTDAGRFAFASGSHVIPAVADEMVAASAHLPILFLLSPEGAVPVFLVGLRNGENALVNSEGIWSGEYIPAFVRRYPFMFGEVEGQDPVTCIDNGYVAHATVTGERLFNEEGVETPILRERIGLMNEYFTAAKRNDVFVKRINELQLLRPVTVDARFDSGASASLHGFLTIDLGKLDALSDEDFLSLRKAGFLAPIYAHFASLACVDKLRQHMEKSAKVAEDQTKPSGAKKQA